MYLAIITLPLLGSIISGFFGRKVGVSGAHIIACTNVVATTMLAMISFYEVGLTNVPIQMTFFRWIDSESFDVSWGFNFDSLTVAMLIPVLIISSLVHIYSIGYMSHDPHNQRFFSYLSLFTFMMIILVTANNFLLMFVGWEGVGICSYLLVSFWFTRMGANQSSISAFLTNRVGDCFLTIGMFAILWSFGNIDYSTVFSLAPYVNENIVTIIGICLLIGAMAKSSQVGLHVWLPMAMEGPTPVSALIHAATMVTAGVYLLIRTSPLIEYSSTVLILALWLGALTTVFSSLIGLFQQDIKKVIAYSTMSQLGMMVIAVGLSSYNVALFHLVNHAFYKALLFLGAGAVIHAVQDQQDFRKFGGLIVFLPLTYSVMLIASLSLVAFPFMTGFYSKDFILESSYGQFFYSGQVIYFIATIAAIFTTLYSVKVLYLTFLSNPHGNKVSYNYAHEGDIFMSSPLIILAIFSIFFGYITKDLFIGLASGFFKDNSIFIHPYNEIMLDTEFAVPHLFKLLPFIFTITFSVIAIILSEFLPRPVISFKYTNIGHKLYSFFNQRFYIEMFYNKYITGLVLNLGDDTVKVLDKGSVELLGPYGLEKGLINLSRNIASLSVGIITNYALYILIGFIFYLSVPYLSFYNNTLLLLMILPLFTIIADYTEDNNNVTSLNSNTNSSSSSSSISLSKNNSNLTVNSLKDQTSFLHGNRNSQVNGNKLTQSRSFSTSASLYVKGKTYAKGNTSLASRLKNTLILFKQRHLTFPSIIVAISVALIIACTKYFIYDTFVIRWDDFSGNFLLVFFGYLIKSLLNCFFEKTTFLSIVQLIKNTFSSIHDKDYHYIDSESNGKDKPVKVHSAKKNDHVLMMDNSSSSSSSNNNNDNSNSNSNNNNNIKRSNRPLDDIPSYLVGPVRELTDVEYHQNELTLVIDAQRGIASKDKLTEAQLVAKAAFEDINEYDTKNLAERYQHHKEKLHEALVAEKALDKASSNPKFYEIDPTALIDGEKRKAELDSQQDYSDKRRKTD